MSQDLAPQEHEFNIASDSFLHMGLDDAVDVVDRGWNSGINYSHVMGDAQVFVMGDTDHREHAALGGLEGQMKAIKEYGIEHFGFEIPHDKKFQDAVDSFYETGDIELLRDIAESSRTPARLLKFFSAAYNVGIQIHLIDIPFEKRDSSWSRNQENELRGHYMGQQLSELAQEHGKVAAFVGYAHLDEVASELNADNVSYTNWALINEGQPDYNPMGGRFFTFKPAIAVSYLGHKGELGTVDLDERFYADGFIYFPKVSLVNGGSKALPAGEVKEGAMVPITSNSILPTFSLDMVKQVDPHVYTWEKTNARRVIDFVSELPGISEGQKVYLGIMLENYIRISADHGGGSVIKIEYDSETRSFGVDTVDLCHYPYQEGVDYGSRAFHREFTLDQLVRISGFDELAVESIDDLPETEILPSQYRPEAGVKILLMMSALQTDPSRVKRTMTSIQIQDKRKQGYIVKMDVNDFDLSREERDLGEVAIESYSTIGNLGVIGVLLDARDTQHWWTPWYNKHLRGLFEISMEEVFREADKLDQQFQDNLLGARHELKYWTETQEFAIDAMGKLDKVVEALDRMESKARKRLLKRRFRNGTLKEALDGARTKITEYRSRFEALVT